jgi:hypothetical protein
MKQLTTIAALPSGAGQAAALPAERPLAIKPPLGLMPEAVFVDRMNEGRVQELRDAIERYINADAPVPPQWIEEFHRREPEAGK